MLNKQIVICLTIKHTIFNKKKTKQWHFYYNQTIAFNGIITYLISK